VLVLSAALALGGAVALACGSRAGIPLVSWGLLMLIAVRYERTAYKDEIPAPPPGFAWTGERVIDGDKIVDVWANDSGERVYVRRGGGLFG
jgi:hypothetical protein